MENLSQIIGDLKAERERIDKAIAVLSSLDGAVPKTSPRRTLSLVARRRIAAAQRARWAKQKSVSSTTAPSKTPKRRISAAGLARIRTAAKARWARVRAEKKK
jgi:hypothetical protein